MPGKNVRGHKKKVKLATLTRYSLQTIMVIVVVAGASLRNLDITFSSSFGIPELRGLCPLGATENLGRLLAGGLDFGKTAAWVLTGLLATALIMGAIFCGRLCPLGTIQEWIGRLGRKLFGRRFNTMVPARMDRILSKLRYGVAALVLLTGAGIIGLTLDLFNPSYALVHVWTSAVPLSALTVALFIIVGSLFVERPWCRWLCPLGAVQGGLGLLSPLTIRRNADLCTNCGRCSRTCPFSIDIASVDAVRDDRCNRCTNCVESCPVEGALAYRTASRAPRLSPVTAGVIGLVLFLLPYGAFSLWDGGIRKVSTETAQTEPENPPLRLTPTMTVKQAAVAANMEPSEFLRLLELEPAFDLDMALIDIEEEADLEHLTFGHIRDILENRTENEDA